MKERRARPDRRARPLLKLVIFNVRCQLGNFPAVDLALRLTPDFFRVGAVLPLTPKFRTFAAPLNFKTVFNRLIFKHNVIIA